MATFTQALLRWQQQFGRKDLPWQQNPSAYRVWISEIMLQQTQVATVIPYYHRFMASFPDVNALANASTDDVLRHWSGLGYYARARNLHRTAQRVRDDHNGVLPIELDKLVELPGIGRSTAGAILSLAHDRRYPILDGNAKRVLARFHAIGGWPGKTAVSKKLWTFAEKHTPQQDVARYTQAIMDLGATICTRSNPKCVACPVGNACAAFRLDAVDAYPGRKPKKGKPLRQTHMVLAHSDGAVYLERRPSEGIWGGLWSLPELESAKDVDEWCERELNALPDQLDQWNTMRHSFTHYDLDIRPIAVRVSKCPSMVQDTQYKVWYEIGSLPPGGIAAPVNTLIQTLRDL